MYRCVRVSVLVFVCVCMCMFTVQHFVKAVIYINFNKLLRFFYLLNFYNPLYKHHFMSADKREFIYFKQNRVIFTLTIWKSDFPDNKKKQQIFSHLWPRWYYCIVAPTGFQRNALRKRKMRPTKEHFVFFWRNPWNNIPQPPKKHSCMATYLLSHKPYK